MGYVVVVGGAGGIGSVTVRRLLADGHGAAVIDAAPVEAADERLDPIRREYGEVPYVRADITSQQSVEEAFDAIPSFDRVVVSAAIVQEEPFLEVSHDVFRKHLDINVYGSFNVGQAAAKRFRRDGTEGRMVFFSSWVQDYPWPDITSYSVSKAGVKQLVKMMARELAPLKIRVNAIAPGIVDSGMARYSLDHDPKYAARVNGRIPLDELQQPEDIAAGVSYLLSEDAQAVTGTTLLVDGGLSLFKFDAPGAEE
ncbi:SDR family NAD(P)-dependent oxidoreductase [Gulosibacter sp. 10]|uniref:SDR family NAD(P)-dependent oxidoreductase n=1 Tax=Gulosibacter sp. 10 TaxID=1255570 RepID=UPI00097F16B5|nr:SDR family oxidoreductase [Gulosibacter sp. 10]SJM59743.1 3-oxoacyl-[acyl-carrier protein] reductase [Gulosibacter sp. 10]